MKKTMTLILAMIMSLGISVNTFAQTVGEQFEYGVIVNGEKMTYTSDDAINVDGTTMFTSSYYEDKFTDAGLTVAEVVKSGAAFNFEGRDYYSIRDVAKANDLKIFWDSASSTAIVINSDKYEIIKTLIEASNSSSENAKKVEMDLDAILAMTISATDAAKLGDAGNINDMSMKMNMNMKMDILTPFLQYDVNAEMLGQSINMKMYDDGTNSYMQVPGEDKWLKTDSSLASGLKMAESINAMNPATNALAVDLSFAGLKMTTEGDDIVLEGNMYVSETFKSFDFDSLMSGTMGMDTQMPDGISMNYDMPKTMYVKYVMDSDGNIKEMRIKFDMGVSVTEGTDTTTVRVSMDANVPTYIVNGDFSTVIPDEVKESAVDMEEYMESQVEESTSQTE